MTYVRQDEKRIIGSSNAATPRLTSEEIATDTRARRIKRGKLEIMVEILTRSMEGTGKTRLMYSANLSFEQLEMYLKTLTEKGFVESIGGDSQGKTYRTTETGRLVVEMYRNMKQVLDGSPSESVHESYRPNQPL